MKEIEKITAEIETEARKNIEGYDFTKMNFKQIMKLVNNDGYLESILDVVLPFAVDSDKQIRFKAINYGCVQESDGKVYPLVCLYFGVKKKRVVEEVNLCLSLSPFNAELSNFEKTSKEFNFCDRDLTKHWRKVLKVFFREKYSRAFKEYCDNSWAIKQKEIETGELIELAQSEDFYNEEINSI